MSSFFILGVSFFFIDTVSMVVCATIYVWLSYGSVTVAYRPVGSCLLIFCFVLFSGVSFVCLCYDVTINFKERKNKMENYKQIAGDWALMPRKCVN